MLINKSNYELFALDYLEDNLNATDQKAMRAFLQAHPDINAELEVMKGDLFTFEADERIVYTNKEGLLKADTPIIAMRPKRWYKMAAAAAIAILLIGFGAGYFAAGHFHTESGVATLEEESKKVEISTDLLEEKETLVAQEIESIPSSDGTVLQDDVESTVESSPIKKVVKKAPQRSVEALPESNSTLANLDAPDERAVESEIEKEMPLESTEEIQETPNRVLAVAELPEVDITITVTSRNVLAADASIVKTTKTQKPKNPIEAITSDKQLASRLSKIKSMLGKLPFEDATLESFVPSYLAGE